MQKQDNRQPATMPRQTAAPRPTGAPTPELVQRLADKVYALWLRELQLERERLLVNGYR